MKALVTLIGSLLLVLILAVGIPWHGSGVEAGTAVRMETAELARAADLIVEGRVLSRATYEAEGMVETEYLLQVERTFKGRDYVHRSFRLPGGVREDGSGMILAGVPFLGAGEDVLIFLSDENVGGSRMPVGLSQGKFRVARDARGEKRLVRDTGGLSLVHPRSGALLDVGGTQVRDYAELVAEIEAALAQARGR